MALWMVFDKLKNSHILRYIIYALNKQKSFGWSLTYLFGKDHLCSVGVCQ